MKRFFKVLLIILLCFVLLVGAYFAYVFLAYKRIDDMQELGVTAPEAAGPDAVAAGEPLKIVSYNVGFGAYSVLRYRREMAGAKGGTEETGNTPVGE